MGQVGKGTLGRADLRITSERGGSKAWERNQQPGVFSETETTCQMMFFFDIARNEPNRGRSQQTMNADN